MPKKINFKIIMSFVSCSRYVISKEGESVLDHGRGRRFGGSGIDVVLPAEVDFALDDATQPQQAQRRRGHGHGHGGCVLPRVSQVSAEAAGPPAPLGLRGLESADGPLGLDDASALLLLLLPAPPAGYALQQQQTPSSNW